ncbi:MAG: leucyl/phenylalanyl-tRNA--protein transferase [Rhodobacteraceae bacterium]|nr:leucyl/phenylalanyl-tRNA--protein transferase [Paracoccaceae bacterium]
MTLSPDLLLHAYSIGIFPMAETRDDDDVFWVDPKLRGVMPLDGFHLSRSLAKTLRRGDYTITIDEDFAGVVDGCADREDTWINPDIRRGYLALQKAGHAHSLEVRDLTGALDGGIYGVTLGGAFFGESMFSRRRDGSKIAIAFLVERLIRAGFTLFDTQFLTPHLASLGGVEMPRTRYHLQLDAALERRAQFEGWDVPGAQDLIDRLRAGGAASDQAT